MEKLLYVTANPKSVDQSEGLKIGARFIEAYQKAHPASQVVHIDLFKRHIPLVDQHTLSAWGKFQAGKDFADLTEDEQAKISAMGAITKEFIEADKYVFLNPLWNFSLPPLMKAYIDNILIAGQTFKYTENGPQGLLEDKKAVHIQTSGGFYTEEPYAQLEHGNRYLKTVLNFIGVRDIESVRMEGINFQPDKIEDFREKAYNEAENLALAF